MLTRLLSVLLLALALSARAETPVVERVELPLIGWAEGPPARMAVVSDLHAAAGEEEGMRALAQQIIALRPAVVALLGDYAYGLEPSRSMAPETLARCLAPLAQSGARVLYILGNHDTPAWDAALRAVGFTPADGRVLRHRFGRGRQVSFAGISFIYQGSRADVARRLPARATKGAPLVVLTHSPYLFLKYAFPQVSGVLAGHTHGGQICWPSGLPLRRNGKYSPEMQRGGRHELPGGGWLYITRGIGYSRVALRVNCPPEITLIEFVPRR